MLRYFLTTQFLVLASIIFFPEIVPTSSKSMRKHTRNIPSDVMELLEEYRNPCPEMFAYKPVGNNLKGIITVPKQLGKNPNTLEISMMGVASVDVDNTKDTKFALNFAGQRGSWLNFEVDLPPEFEHWVLISMYVNNNLVCRAGILHAELEIPRTYFHYSAIAQKDASKRRRGLKRKNKKQKSRRVM